MMVIGNQLPSHRGCWELEVLIHSIDHLRSSRRNQEVHRSVHQNSLQWRKPSNQPNIASKVKDKRETATEAFKKMKVK
jgi:hypothetical protein